jgi:hypothetical protein
MVAGIGGFLYLLFANPPSTQLITIVKIWLLCCAHLAECLYRNECRACLAADYAALNDSAKI